MAVREAEGKQIIINDYAKEIDGTEIKGTKYVRVEDVPHMLDEYYAYKVFLYDMNNTDA